MSRIYATPSAYGDSHVAIGSDDDEEADPPAAPDPTEQAVYCPLCGEVRTGLVTIYPRDRRREVYTRPACLSCDPIYRRRR